ncbi:amidohydrolase family protein [Massilia putida]|uniref:amidohydrolase family protein n=1 Tax=Massilia putida TaxID=1141883 RepID=UPI000950CE90|nr:amidohydrolase family protein [Massilia putida]
MDSILFKNVQLFDGSGRDRFRAEVLVEGPRIRAVAQAPGGIPADNARVIDCGGATLMPGLIEPHAHLSFLSSVGRIFKERTIPPEEHLLVTAHNARVLLDAGFTSAYSAGSKGPRFEIALQKELRGGYLPGPRLVSSTFERPAGADKERDGPDSIRAFVKAMAQEGVGSIKLLLSGDDAFGPGGSMQVHYTEAEVAAAAEEAREAGVWLAAHAQARDSVKMAVRHGFRIVYHCTYADSEALDMLEAAKDRIFVAPAIGIVYAKAYLGEAFGFTRDVVERAGFVEQIERNQEVYGEMRRRGIRVLPGGDYGFPWNPIGANARDLELFVKLFGYTPAETLVAATRLGAQLMGMEHELGQIRPGFLADLLLVDGDPVADIRILQQPDKLLAIMQNGKFHKVPVGALQRAAVLG